MAPLQLLVLALPCQADEPFLGSVSQSQAQLSSGHLQNYPSIHLLTTTSVSLLRSAVV